MHRYNKLSGVLGALPVLECAARQMSFSRAASELCLTQPAVSRRISNMEKRLGISLFERNHNQLRLTQEGKRILAATELSLGHLEKVLDEIGGERPKSKLTIACGISFACLWLQPRFTSLRQFLDNKEFHLIASETTEDLDPKMIDIRILWQKRRWPNREIRSLFPQVSFPVCSPEFAGQHGLSITDPDLVQRLAALPLLRCHSDGAHDLGWTEWFAMQDVIYTEQNVGYIHDSVLYMIQSALDSEGIALGNYHFVEQYLERGDLVQIGPIVEGSDSIGWIEFEPGRLSKQDRDRIFEWFRNESKVSVG